MIGKIAAFSVAGKPSQHAGIITFFNQNTDEVTIRDFEGNIWNGWGYQIKLLQSEEPNMKAQLRN